MHVSREWRWQDEPSSAQAKASRATRLAAGGRFLIHLVKLACLLQTGLADGFQGVESADGVDLRVHGREDQDMGGG